MKSFGVRLGAGAVTILFGAYAAALAQKDRQDESDSWTAETPSLAAPASPIADIGDDSWLHQPATELEQGAAADHSLDATFQPAGSVQLVQHTEPVAENESPQMPSFGGPLPATLGVPAESFDEDVAADDGPPNADWLMPDPGQAPAVAAAAPAMSMTFPGAESVHSGNHLDLESGPSAQLNGDAPAELTVADVPSMEFYPAEQVHTDAEPLEAANQEHTFKAGPAIVGTGAAIGAAAAVAASSGGSDVPTNLLRGAPEGVNELRLEEDAPPMDAPPMDAPPMDAELAYDSKADGDSVLFAEAPQAAAPPMNFAEPPGGSPAPKGFAPASSVGQPTGYGDPAGYGQATGYGQPNLAAAPDRMASLPQDPQRSIDGLPIGYQPAAMAQPGAAVAIDPSSTLDSPGERRLEGVQTPSIVIQKRAPAEVKVGKPASFVVHVQNVGSVEALNVEVHDRVPAGMRLVDASPSPIQQGTMLMWELGAMPAGDERTITMQLIPEQEGELGSVARVSFEAAASVRTISTRPELKIVQRIPEQGVLIGQQLEIELEVSNPGSGAATGVTLQEDVPEGLEHPKGRQLDNALGTLAPGEVRNQVLRLRAVAPGIIQNTIRLAGDDGLTAEHTVTVHVVAPELQVELSGPSKRFLERQATYQLNVANNGTADATNVEIAVQLDRGFTFVSTDYEGQYDPTRHAVYWSLAQLPAGAKGSVPLTLLPVEAGEQAIKIEARADLGVTAKSERTMSVEGFAELSFAISNAGGPIEVGAETTYEIVVNNSGSKADSNVSVQLQLPQGLELVSTDGQAGTDGRGLVAFQPKAQLAPGEELKYSLRVRGVSPGTHIVRAIVVSEQSTVPVTKEDSTRVYADQ